MKAVLEAEDIRTVCGSGGDRVVAVDGASLSIQPGEVVGLIGESGSGKTTFVRSLIGLLGRSCQVTSGQITFDGQRVFGHGLDELSSIRGSRVGMVFQNPTSSLNPLLKIGSMISEVLKTHGLAASEIPARTDELLTELGFDDPARTSDSYPHQLSGGMCQRAAIALAIAPEPDLVIADECTSALDVTTQAEVITLLRKITHQQQLAMLFVTHDILLASELCTRLVVLYGGNIVEDGPVDDVVGSPRHPYTRALLEAVPLWQPRGELKGIPGSPTSFSPGFIGCRFSPRCPRATEECRAADVPWSQVSDDHGHRCLFPMGGSG